MSATRRIGAENSATRTAILDATEQVMIEEGYAAASTRRVAARAGLKPSLVHYYFPTTEDLHVAVYRRAAAWATEELEKALASADPLMALWHYTIDTTRTALTLEFMAMAAHRKSLQEAIGEHSSQSHALQVAVIERALGKGKGSVPPEVLSTLIAAVGRSLVMESGIGSHSAHQETRAWFENWLSSLT